MKLKRIVCTLLITLCFCSLFASEYSISISNAEQVSVSGNIYELSGNVILKFTTEDDSSSVERSLTAGVVRIDTDNNRLEASQNVVLNQGDDSFKGESVVLDWDELDVVVYDGSSASDRKNAGGTSVKFYAKGQKISYAGGENTVFFSDGVIATKEKAPYWSVKAKNIGLLESDLFFENATLRIGRVPVLWIPFFFYPGTRMAFNPSIGLDSSKGMYLNTTTEICGLYPNFSSSSGSADSEDAASNILSFMAADQEDVVRDGIIYRQNADVELSEFEKKAREKKNYFALFADVYEKIGPAVGFETLNHLNKFEISSSSMLGYSKNRFTEPLFRYISLNSINWNEQKTSLNLLMPIYSDPYAAQDYLNRNSFFDVGALLGSTQTFPSTYSYVDEYHWSLNANTSFKLKNISFSINSVKADIEFGWDREERKFVVETATLPYVSFSSSGTIFSVKGKQISKEKKVEYKSELASSFAEELSTVLPNENEKVASEITPMKGPTVASEKKSTYEAPFITSSYSYKQTFSNQYLSEMKPQSIGTDISGSLSLNGRLPYNIMAMTLSTTPSYKYNKNNVQDIRVQSFAVPVSVKLSVPLANVNYVITGNVYKAEEKEEEWTESKFEFTDKWVTSHYVEASRSVGNLTLSLKTNLKPVVQSVIPSVSFSKNGFTASLSGTVYLDKDNSSHENKGSLNFSYSKNSLSASFNNSYDFSLEGWAGLTSSQSLSYKLFNKVLLSESLKMNDCFKVQSMVVSASYDKTKVSLSFSGENFEKDTLDASTSFVIKPVYFWKNRIGLSSNVSSKFSYDFQNEYGTSFSLDMSLDFAIKDFISLGFSVKTANTSFYRYYEDGQFVFNLLWEDLKNSFAFFEQEKRRNTGFNLSSYSLNITHYMEDWDLYVSAGTSIVNENGNPTWNPKVSVSMKWRAIPALKIQNSWTEKSGWEK